MRTISGAAPTSTVEQVTGLPVLRVELDARPLLSLRHPRRDGARHGGGARRGGGRRAPRGRATLPGGGAPRAATRRWTPTPSGPCSWRPRTALRCRSRRSPASARSPGPRPSSASGRGGASPSRPTSAVATSPRSSPRRGAASSPRRGSLPDTRSPMAGSSSTWSERVTGCSSWSPLALLLIFSLLYLTYGRVLDAASRLHRRALRGAGWGRRALAAGDALLDLRGGGVHRRRRRRGAGRHGAGLDASDAPSTAGVEPRPRRSARRRCSGCAPC